MFHKIILFLFMLIFSFILFFIDNFYIISGLLIISIIISISSKIRLPLYYSFGIFLLINFIFNYLFSDFSYALIVIERLIIMFIVVNIVINKIGINSIGEIIEKITGSRNLSLIITISLSFIPIMIKEIKDIRKSLSSKNFSLNLKNVLTKPNVFVLTFFNNLFKRVNEMEKSFLAKGVDE